MSCCPVMETLPGPLRAPFRSAICHGVSIEDYALIGMGAVLLGGCRIGEGSIIGAGALVLEDAVIPPWSLAVGSPARVIRTFDAEERRVTAIAHAAHYVERAREHADGIWDHRVEA